MRGYRTQVLLIYAIMEVQACGQRNYLWLVFRQYKDSAFTVLEYMANYADM